MLHYRAKCAECIYFRKTKCKRIKYVGNLFQLLIQFRGIKPWWSFEEEESFYPSVRELWSFLFKDFFLDRAFLLISHCVWNFFFKTSSPSLLELWIPWLHEPDRCSAAQVRVTFAPIARQEASALLQDYCSQCHATRQKHFCHRENTFLILGNWKPVADSHEVPCHSTHGSSLSCFLNSY